MPAPHDGEQHAEAGARRVPGSPSRRSTSIGTISVNRISARLSPSSSAPRSRAARERSPSRSGANIGSRVSVRAAGRSRACEKTIAITTKETASTLSADSAPRARRSGARPAPAPPTDRDREARRSAARCLRGAVRAGCSIAAIAAAGERARGDASVPSTKRQQQHERQREAPVASSASATKTTASIA